MEDESGGIYVLIKYVYLAGVVNVQCSMFNVQWSVPVCKWPFFLILHFSSIRAG